MALAKGAVPVHGPSPVSKAPTPHMESAAVPVGAEWGVEHGRAARDCRWA